MEVQLRERKDSAVSRWATKRPNKIDSRGARRTAGRTSITSATAVKLIQD